MKSPFSYLPSGLLQITLFYFIVLLLSTTEACAQDHETARYLGQKPPGLTPQVFAPEFISFPDQSEFGSIFSEDGKEFFYGVDTEGKAEIRYTQWQDGTWSTPTSIITHATYSYNDPFLTPDQQQLFFISDQPLSGTGAKKDYDIWYATRTESGWSAPINAGPAINTKANEYYISFTQDTTMYFSSNIQATEPPNNYDIYTSARKNGVFQPAVKLGEAVNSASYEADVFVAQDSSYLIFCGARPGGYGRGDLYISFRKNDGTWSAAENMGTSINTEGHELCPFVTRDGRYFFYTSQQDIYWVDAGVIEQFRVE